MYVCKGLTTIYSTSWPRSCSTCIWTNQVGLVELVGFFMCSIGNQPFSVGLVAQLFQPTQTLVELVELVEKDGYINCYQNRGLLSMSMFSTLSTKQMVEMHPIGTIAN